MRQVGYASCMGEWRNAYRVLVGKHEMERPFGGPRHGWKDNIKWILWKWDEGVWSVDWINVARGNGSWWVIVNMVMNRQVP